MSKRYKDQVQLYLDTYHTGNDPCYEFIVAFMAKNDTRYDTAKRRWMIINAAYEVFVCKE